MRGFFRSCNWCPFACTIADDGLPVIVASTARRLSFCRRRVFLSRATSDTVRTPETRPAWLGALPGKYRAGKGTYSCGTSHWRCAGLYRSIPRRSRRFRGRRYRVLVVLGVVLALTNRRRSLIRVLRNRPGFLKYTYIHTYIHTYICTCMHTYIHTYIHTYLLLPLQKGFSGRMII